MHAYICVEAQLWVTTGSFRPKAALHEERRESLPDHYARFEQVKGAFSD
jgi:hypothetical protein